MKPMKIKDIKYLGIPVYMEVEGYSKVVKVYIGNLAYGFSKICGYKTLGEVIENEHKHRCRCWVKRPSKKERKESDYWFKS